MICLIRFVYYCIDSIVIFVLSEFFTIEVVRVFERIDR